MENAAQLHHSSTNYLCGLTLFDLQPPSAEVEAFARRHGVEPLEEPQLLQLAKDTLSAPLPRPWVPV